MSQLMELTTEECLSLLGRRKVGRIALSTPAGLRIYPVNYAVHQDRIVFRTLPYGEIANNAHDADVAFQIDDMRDDLQQGWSVLAVGRCRRVEDPEEVRVIREEADPAPWAGGQRILYFRLDWTDLTGRQVGIAERPSLIPTSPTAP
jgi:nitroimidazol reductase NimA-like FMN-containing flavoprotein (pyridoxamine 5'-phosphate oxidase superfamily)